MESDIASVSGYKVFIPIPIRKITTNIENIYMVIFMKLPFLIFI